MNSEKKSMQKAERLIFMYQKFLSGRRISTNEMLDILNSEGCEVSDRTVQRDLRLLQDCVKILEDYREDGHTYWKIPKELRYSNNLVQIDTNELLSFYILKAHLKTFSGTMIEKEAELLKKKLEELAPGDAFSGQSLYWDQNTGQYNYTDCDDMLRKIIRFITDNKWATLTYKSSIKNKAKTYDVLLKRLFSYSGILYVSAYHPKHDDFIALTLQGIIDLKESDKSHGNAPDFDFRKFTKTRFGVFTDSRLRKVVLKIEPEYAHYFENRKWHQSQKEYYDDDSNYIIQLRVPIVPDFVAWLMSWGRAVTVLKPQCLIDKIKDEYKNVLKKYE